MTDAALQTAYLAPEGYEEALSAELGPVEARYGRLFLCRGAARRLAWAENTWHAPRVLRIDSIGDGVRKLRGLQRNWALYSHAYHRRAQLVEDQLPHVSSKPLQFPNPPPSAPLGSFTLIDPDHVLASTECESPFPNGRFAFVEDAVSPPNRAYLKLWEAMTRFGKYPKPGERCLDLGSSPGGWTWVAQSLGAHVISVDRADLDPKIARLPNIDFRMRSAFGIDPLELPPIDWMFCDVACYPERLLELVLRWIRSGRCRKIIATVKLQGEWKRTETSGFQELPGATLVHLFHNKHELTFLWEAETDSPVPSEGLADGA